MNDEQKWIVIGNERFFYEKEILFHGRKKIDRVISKENLQIFHSVIEPSEITYGLFFGTLLGAVREKNFIEHDEDIDIYVLDEEREKFLRLLGTFKKKGLDVVRYEYDMISLMRNNEYIDIYFLKQKLKYGIFKVRVFNNEYEYAAKNLENPVKQLFLGMNIFMPQDPEKVIKKIYGKDWRIPLINRPSQPNTVYSKFSKMSTLIKRLPFGEKIERITKQLLKKAGL